MVADIEWEIVEVLEPTFKYTEWPQYLVYARLRGHEAHMRLEWSGVSCTGSETLTSLLTAFQKIFLENVSKGTPRKALLN